MSNVSLYLDLSKNYADVTTGMAHDSHTATVDHKDSDSVRSWVDQTLVPIEQFRGGIRTARISTGARFGHSEIMVQHTVLLGYFKDYLKQVVAFLKEDRNAIITLIDEGDNGIGWSSAEYWDKLTETYAQELGGTSDRPGSDEITWVYVPEGDATQWPTLQEMVDRNTRLVVFMTKEQHEDKTYDWILPAYAPDGQIGMNVYKAYGSDPDSLLSDSSLKLAERWPNSGNPKLYLFNHYFYQKEWYGEESSRANSEYTVGLRLIRDTLHAWQRLGLRPNFLNVDFFQGVWGAHSQLIPLCDAMNKSDTPEQARDIIYTGLFCPPGSYRLSSNSARVRLTADLKNTSGGWQPAELDITHMNASTAIANVNGSFVVGSPQTDFTLMPVAYKPIGSYTASARNVRVILSANLGMPDSTDTHYSELDITNYTIGDIGNKNGNFVITPPDK